MKNLGCLLLLMVSLQAQAESAEDIVKGVEKSLSPGDFIVTYELVNRRLDGTIVAYEVDFQIKDIDHAHGIFQKPEREKGREVLRVHDALWTYMPDVGRAIRIADRDSFAGGDFSNADIMRPDWTAHYKAQMAKETPKQWIIDMIAGDTEAAYAKMRLWVDRETHMPMQQHFFDSSGTLLKQCRYGAITRYDTLQRPARLHMENVLTGQATDMRILRLSAGQKFSDARFSVDNLGK